MPRTSNRGGARQGALGQTYANRSDLNGPATQPIQVAPSQQYGQGVAQTQAQQAIPLPNSNVLPSNPQQAVQAQQAAASIPAGPMPGEMPGLQDPSLRPNEPVTHGAPSGPGGGPEVLQSGLPMNSVSSMLSSLAQTSNSADLAVLAQAAGAMGQ